MPVTEVDGKTFFTSVNSKLMALNFNAGYGSSRQNLLYSVNSKLMALNFNAGYGSRRQNLLYFRKFKAYGIKFQYQLRKYPAKLTLLP